MIQALAVFCGTQFVARIVQFIRGYLIVSRLELFWFGQMTVGLWCLDATVRYFEIDSPSPGTAGTAGTIQFKLCFVFSCLLVSSAGSILLKGYSVHFYRMWV